ncbi:hypothetical protein B0J13DRAFT_549892 [Dactylonectria estremocensis]|uniref:Uncharacterized protein n=1 Tax=Dactylonectria estremocensis TaxID=1079267 RepID=A0A9P9J6P6_9HYPO|nr:hypothetical protein B0J13DRAFT_549892 [Dactylonectria estremocensis]
MSPFMTLFRLDILFVAAPMALSPRDAIHSDDLSRYDAFMADIADTHFLDMYLETNMITINVYEGSTNELARSQLFSPSSNAHRYFDQENEAANEVLGSSSQSGSNERRLCKPSGHTGRSEIPNTLGKRLSSCYFSSHG